MAQKDSFVLPWAILLLASFGALSAGPAKAQDPVAISPTRILGDWHTSDPVFLPRSTPPTPPEDPHPDSRFQSEIVRAVPPADARLDRILLLLAPSPARRQALTADLDNLQNPRSPRYHRWLTSAAFAHAYANSAADISAVSAWLASEGFTVAPLPAGRGWIEFSGTVAQVEQAFQTRVVPVSPDLTQADQTQPDQAQLAQTQLAQAQPDPLRKAQPHQNQTRFVLSQGISVPAVLAPLIQGLVSLDGTLATPALTPPQSLTVTAAQLAAQRSPAAAAALTPRLAAQLLDADAVLSSGTTGAGQTIAIPARSTVNSNDVAAFRAAFGLPPSPLQIVPADLGSSRADPNPNSTPNSDPGPDQAAATLAASWAGALAPGAQIILVPAATTNATDGLDLSLAAVVDQELAHTVAVGYSTCEAALTPAHQAFYAALYRQAAAEGISIVAAAGDSGPSACHPAASPTPVTSGYGVSALASTPWDTAVGVAAFADSSPSLEPSALSAWSLANPDTSAYAGGGGSSSLYASPAWQPIPPQFQSPSAHMHSRLLPDIALPAAIDSAANPGLAFCFSGANPSSGCTLQRAGGSSAAAALFAGLAALVEQKYGAQGNLAPHLYALSRQTGLFTDIDQGSARLLCAAGSSACGPDGLIGFSAAIGYDLATGLGVADAQKLVSLWATPQTTGTSPATVNLQASPTQPNSTYNPSASVTLTATVVSGNGGATPTGTVQFVDSSEMQPLDLTPATLNGSGTASITVEGDFGSGGNEIFVTYSGDGTYAAATSSPDLNINIEPSTTSLAVVPSATSVTPGQTISVTVNLTVGSPVEGTVPPSGLVTLDLDGLPTTTASLRTASGVTSATFSLVIPATSTLATHALQAVYAGDTNYSASTSPAVSVTVSKSATTTTVTPATTTPSAGSSLMVTATVTSSGTGTTAPTGTVNFVLDNVSQGIVPVATVSSTTASVTIPSIAAGAHVLAATYSGDGNFAASTSTPVSVTAAKGATVTTLTATPPALAAGSTETFVATVAPLNPITGTVYTLTGMVSFYDGGVTLLGTAAVTSGAATLSAVQLANNVAHSITAVYSGDPNWLTSTSPALPLAATTLPVTIVLSSNLATVSPGQALILTAIVTPTGTPATGSEQNPTGNIVFYNGTATIGSVALVPSPIGNSSSATLTTQTLAGGQAALSAVYAGDQYFNAATSNILTLGIEDFTIVPSPSNPGTNLNIVQGTSGTASFVVTGLGGYNNGVQVVCAVPSQDNMTCTTSPQQLTPPGTVSFVIQTFLPGQQTSTATVSRRTPPAWPRAAGGTALALLGFLLLPIGRRARIFGRNSTRRMWIVLLLLLGLGGAGIGCSSVTGAGTTGTPLGVATLQITATAYIDNTVVSHSVFLTVNVLAPGSTP